MSRLQVIIVVVVIALVALIALMAVGLQAGDPQPGSTSTGASPETPTR